MCPIIWKHEGDRTPNPKNKPRPRERPVHSLMRLCRAGSDIPLKLSDEFYYWLDTHSDSVEKIQEEKWSGGLKIISIPKIF